MASFSGTPRTRNRTLCLCLCVSLSLSKLSFFPRLPFLSLLPSFPPSFPLSLLLSHSLPLVLSFSKADHTKVGSHFFGHSFIQTSKWYTQPLTGVGFLFSFYVNSLLLTRRITCLKLNRKECTFRSGEEQTDHWQTCSHTMATWQISRARWVVCMTTFLCLSTISHALTWNLSAANSLLWCWPRALDFIILFAF